MLTDRSLCGGFHDTSVETQWIWAEEPLYFHKTMHLLSSERKVMNVNKFII